MGCGLELMLAVLVLMIESSNIEVVDDIKVIDDGVVFR